MAQDARTLAVELLAQALRRKNKPVERALIAEGVSFSRELGLDSLDVVQVALALQERLGVSVAPGELAGLDDLGALVAAVSRGKGSGGPAKI